MTSADVFISHKRDTHGQAEPRTVQLVQALERHGPFSVWWDHEGLPGGESWRQRIESALDGSRCVIVLWTHEAVGDNGGFVRGEASRAQAQGKLISVLLDSVKLPLGFGESQALDLRHWRGRPGDVFFQDLLATVRAKLAGQPAPPPRGPGWRLRRRLLLGSAGSLPALLVGAFALNALNLQDATCTAAVLQPGLSDACGALGWGHRPAKEERLAWEGLPAGDCQALRDFRARFPAGVLSAQAQALVEARQTSTQEDWLAPEDKRLPLAFASGDAVARPTIAAAQAEALARHQAAAQRLCQGLVTAGHYRLESAQALAPEPSAWDCQRLQGGWVCGGLGQARCEVRAREQRLVERCVSARDRAGQAAPAMPSTRPSAP
jgi:TIR domain